MGNSLCCTNNSGLGPHDADDDVIPIELHKTKLRSIGSSTMNLSLKSDRTQSFDYTALNPLNKSLSTAQLRKLKDQSKIPGRNDQPNVEIELQFQFPIKYLSFSQRKHLGFRNRFEFDKKRLIIGSKREFSVVGYDHNKNVYELYKQCVSYDEEIRHIQFIEDHVPSFVFLITFNKLEQKSYFKILKLRKNKDFQKDQAGRKIEETKMQIQLDLIQKYKMGDFKEKRKKSYDNLELVPTKQSLNSQANDNSGRNSVMLISGRSSKISNAKQTEQILKLAQENQQTLTSNNSFDNEEESDGKQNQSGFKKFFNKIFSRRQSMSINKEELILGDYQETLPRDSERTNYDQMIMTESGDQKNPFLQYLREENLKALQKQNDDEQIILLKEPMPFITEEFGKLQLQENVLRAFLFNNPTGTYLFTLEEGKKLCIYIIKSYISQSQLKSKQTTDNQFYFKSSNISNFKMAKRATLELEYQPKSVEFYGDFFIIIYKNHQVIGPNKQSTYEYTHRSFIDIVEKSGKPISRVDLGQIMENNGLVLQSIKMVKFPRLQWSDRKIEEYDLSKSTVLKKAIVAGECLYDGKVRPFIVKINLDSQIPDVIKVLRMEDEIVEIGYGPYDNGYLIIGLKSGQVLVFDTINLNKLHQMQVFASPISKITFEPTNMIFISSKEGDLVGLSIIQKEMHYVYLDLGKKQYCTVALPKNGNKEMKEHLNQNNNIFCL
ncbi:UNKNOWN [Stylonychia lemnae]|uniref:Uncharacterized protein n=1 Tax=Stylonychia lemnae TaxID=5949 RepID=A0A078A147_STYLE|nr:UNKNOWN [Stylonychia lemnae]|eukprot:CDW75572.1 UNKNOWN [Stylonychia lemnae]